VLTKDFKPVKSFIRKAISPLKVLIADSRFTGILLIACTVFSLVLSNSPYGDWYRQIWNYDLLIFGYLPHSFLKWINDFLMAIFFFYAGMEIKRELVEGELSSFKKAILPFGAALGGMMLPALIYSSFNISTNFAHGWGIPTATDIAFSIGIASLLGKRVPNNLKIFLLALAIIDDLGAIIVIALFYGNEINWSFLLIAAFVYALLWLCNYKKIKAGIIQLVLGLSLWFLIFNSGIEAGISGVLIAFAMPVRCLPNLENGIHKLVNFLILPLFAIANTAIIIPPNVLGALQSSIGIGVIAGLVIGKPVGIFIFSRAMISLNIAHIPTNTNLKQLLGTGSLAGIGFTMSIFTTSLAFNNEQFKDTAKIAILASLLLSTIFSWLYFISLRERKSVETVHRKPPPFSPQLTPA
jgi:NhaA family Na+:H+ antiporter